MSSSHRLAGKRALVTGASSGIGRAIALAFAAEGAGVAGCGRDADRTHETCAMIARHGGDALPLVCDLADPTEAQRAVHVAANGWGALDIVVNCAGISEVDGWASVHEHTLEGWSRTFAVDVTAPFLIAKSAIPLMLDAGGGAFVHIGSIAGEVVLTGNAAYGAAKAALNQLSNHIAVEYAAHNIRSNMILPGEIETPASTRAFTLAAASGSFTREGLLARYPAARFGSADEIARTALFLCSDDAPFLTGASIHVDGAYTRV